MTATLHYIYDPLCGWCYGAAPLAEAASTVTGLDLKLHGGGLWPEPTKLPEQTRRYIQQADARIAQMSGQSFGDAYLNGLLLDPDLELDSRPTIAAVLTALALDPSSALAMVQAIQRGHYIEGRHVVEPEVLLDLAAETGFDREAFAATFAATDPQQHIESTRRLMEQIGAAGFPTFVLERDGQLYAVPHNRFARNTEGFREWLAGQIQTVVH
jgi:putative protein-disulfide isomerase